MDKEGDSSKYCTKCKKRDTCTIMCAPVEELLRSVTVPEHERLPREFVDSVRKTGKYWVSGITSKKQQIRELFFIDRRGKADIALLAGCSLRYVNKIIQNEKQ